LNILKVLKSIKYGINGLVLLIKSENNFQFHFIFGTIVLLMAYLFDIALSEFLWILSCIFLMFSAEAFNTAIEKICNKISLEKDHQIGIIKDISAGGVLLIAIFSICVGLLIFIPKIISIF
jgi:diacylglycerol kinase